MVVLQLESVVTHTIVSSLLQQTVRLAQIRRAKPIVIRHEDVNGLRRRRQEQSRSGDEAWETHLVGICVIGVCWWTQFT